jgi:hypothetical protein
MACNRSRIEHVSSAQYVNLHTGDGEVVSVHLKPVTPTALQGQVTAQPTHRVSTSPHSSPEKEPSSLCKLATSAPNTTMSAT